MVEDPVQCLDPLSDDLFARVQRRTIFDHHKWDPQVGDVQVLARFGVKIRPQAWIELTLLAESLAGELMAAEAELGNRHDLYSELAIPWSVRRVFRRRRGELARGVARVIRFDFHWTADGWRISEANVDVPGGFNEAEGFTALMAEAYGGYGTCGSPATAIVSGFERAGIARGSLIAFVHARAYMDDRQVMRFLADRFEGAGYRAALIAPDQIKWTGVNQSAEYNGESIGGIVRFFPGEWLPNLMWSCRWGCYFAGSSTPMCNPGVALLAQSKRLPIVWDKLETPMATWKRLLPETRDPRSAEWRRDRQWIVKPVFGRIGDGIGMHGVTDEREWKRIAASVRRWPGCWVAQRRFDALPVRGATGEPRYLCVGVYTVDGRASGVYGRIAPRPLINAGALDVAVLLSR